MSKTVLFQKIQLSITLLFSSIWPIDRTLSGATTLGPSGPGRNGNKEVLRIPQSSSITGASPSDCLVSYFGHSLGCLTPLQRSSRCILQPQPTELTLFCLVKREWFSNIYTLTVKAATTATFFQWLIAFNGVSTRIESFYVQGLGNRVHCTFIFTFVCFVVSLELFFESNTYDFKTDLFDL